MLLCLPFCVYVWPRDSKFTARVAVPLCWKLHSHLTTAHHSYAFSGSTFRSYKQTNKQRDQHALGWHGGGGQTSSVRAIEGGMRHRQLHVFELCQLSFSPREGDYIDWITYWMSLVNEFDKWTSAPLIGSVVTITPSPPLYHLRTFYITRYTFPSTYPSQTMYPFNELQQNRKRTRNKRRGKKGGKKNTG